MTRADHVSPAPIASPKSPPRCRAADRQRAGRRAAARSRQSSTRPSRPCSPTPSLEMSTAARPLSRASTNCNNPQRRQGRARSARLRAVFLARADSHSAATAHVVPARGAGPYRLYVYRRDTLLRLAALAPRPAGARGSRSSSCAPSSTASAFTSSRPTTSVAGVDTPEDLERVRQHDAPSRT